MGSITTKPQAPGVQATQGAFYAIDSRPIAYVVFTRDTTIKSLWYLHRDYRHCYLMIGREPGPGYGEWVVIDPCANIINIYHTAVDVESLNRRQDVTAIVPVMYSGPRPTPARAAPLMPLTCVEVIKRYMGIHHRLILTPYQLYRYLTK